MENNKKVSKSFEDDDLETIIFSKQIRFTFNSY